MQDLTTMKMVALAVDLIARHGGLPEDCESVEQLITQCGARYLDEVTPESIARVLDTTPRDLLRTVPVK